MAADRDSLSPCQLNGTRLHCMHVVVNSKLLAGLAGIWSASVCTASGCQVVALRTVGNSRFGIDLQDRGFISSIWRVEGKQDKRPGSPARHRRDRISLCRAEWSRSIRQEFTYNSRRRPSVIHDKLTTTNAKRVSIQHPKALVTSCNAQLLLPLLLLPCFSSHNILLTGYPSHWL